MWPIIYERRAPALFCFLQKVRLNIDYSQFTISHTFYAPSASNGSILAFVGYVNFAGPFYLHCSAFSVDSSAFMPNFEPQKK